MRKTNFTLKTIVLPKKKKKLDIKKQPTWDEEGTSFQLENKQVMEIKSIMQRK